MEEAKNSTHKFKIGSKRESEKCHIFVHLNLEVIASKHYLQLADNSTKNESLSDIPNLRAYSQEFRLVLGPCECVLLLLHCRETLEVLLYTWYQ